MAPSGTVTRGKGKASSTAASRPASRSGSPPADDANTTIVPGTITLAQFRDPGDLPSQIPGFPSTSYLGQTASSSASIIEGISSSTPFEHANNPALSHEPTPAYRSYTHYRPPPSAVPADTGRRSPAASTDHLFFLALLFLQSYLVHATQLQRRPSLHIMQNWAGCAWPQRGQLYKGARRLLRKRKEEELTGLHIASPLSERRRIYTTCKAAA